MKHIKNIILFTAFTTVSCTSLPSSASDLTHEIISESNKRHELNVSLVNQLFDERKNRLNTFINDYYTPKVIENYQKLIPESVNYKEELPNIVKSIIPVINRKRDSLQQTLDKQRQELLLQLNTNAQTYNQATASLQNLIDSYINVQTKEKSVLNMIEKLTKTKDTDIKNLENSFQHLLNEAGNVSDIFLKTKEDIQNVKK